ncbi:Hpt domain-containing protein [Phenylobacterium sp. J367]|uniref:Hpt domain-containing protein n=1 Tax=Phenylobacterium sp. J367 TaxID=2898435 RepID=UPI002150B248|nr:Hpt domain-containing protein [Phenylobacterium sp. J367]MCR5879780.1 Hpt domain-containing protein [Phenylobacterium sp. J367]
MTASDQTQIIDFAYLEGFAAGDMEVVLDVLALFCQQAESWAEGLDSSNPDWRAVTHTIKGAARGIGARTLGDACETAEFGATEDLPAAKAALDDAVAEIRLYRAKRS